MACLVKGVYLVERDRQEVRQGDQERAPAWWKAFNFKCIEFLKDEVDFSITLLQKGPRKLVENGLRNRTITHLHLTGVLG